MINSIHHEAFASLMEDRGFKRIGPGMWRSGMITAGLSGSPERVSIRHKSGLTFMDETLYSGKAFNAVLAAVERMDFKPAKNTVFLAMAGVHNTTHYLTTANGEPHVVHDPHVLGPAATFQKLNRMYKINRNISIAGVALRDKEVMLTAFADGRVELCYVHEGKTITKRIAPETASHILTCERVHMDLDGAWHASNSGPGAMIEEVAFLAPTSEYQWRVASKGMNIPIKGKATFNIRKGGEFGLRKKGEKFYAVQLKDKDMSEYQISSEKYDKLLGLSSKRRGKSPDLTGKEKKTHKKKVDTSPRNKATTKTAVVSPRTKALRKVPAKPIEKPASIDSILEQYQEYFRDKKWTGVKMAKMLKEAGVKSGPSNKKVDIISYLAKYHGLSALNIITTHDQEKTIEENLNDKDRALVEGAKSFDWNVLFRVGKRVAPHLLPDTRDPNFKTALTIKIVTNKVMTAAEWVDALTEEKKNLDDQVNRIRNPKKTINIPPPPVIRGSTTYPGPVVRSLTNPKGSPLYTISENDDSVSRAIKQFLISLKAWGSDVAEHSGAYNPSYDQSFLTGKARTADFKIRTHPHIIGVDEQGNPQKVDHSTQYFFDAFKAEYEKASSPIKIHKITDARTGQPYKTSAAKINDVVDIYFTVKSEPKVLLISRLHLHPDDDKYESLMAGQHRNMNLGEQHTFKAHASKSRKINLLIAAVPFNPVGEQNETFRILASLVEIF
jgi:hypothetical protein